MERGNYGRHRTETHLVNFLIFRKHKPGKRCTMAGQIPSQTRDSAVLITDKNRLTSRKAGFPAQQTGEIMIRRTATLLLSILAVVPVVYFSSYAQSQALLTRHVREVTRNGEARPVGHLPGTQSMRLVVALPLRNHNALENFLQKVYDPSSASFHHFLSVKEFTREFGPTQQDYSAVVEWAKANGFQVAGTSRNRVNLDIVGSVANIERALHVTMGVYQHPSEGRTFYAPDREPTPDVPVQLWHISGLDNYSIPHPALVHRSENPEAIANATTGSCPGQSFCGSDMRAAYYEGTALTGAGQSVGLFEFLGTDLADLYTYYANVGQTLTVPVTVLSTDGSSTSCEEPDCDDNEQTLDMTQALGMAPGLSSLVMYVGGTDSAIFNAMATASPLNAQLSSSWIWNPADPSTDDPYFKEFAAQGQNLFQAAGDGGAWTSGSELYPADDAYLTSVGGTDLNTTGPGGDWASETAWADGGGGIGPDKLPIPFWQTTAAAGCSSCSDSYRNGPDVSANSDFTFYVCSDQTTCTENYWGGTSFAAPMWAGYLALVNQQSVENGGTTLGFINPALYAIGEGSGYDSAFHDITSGSNGYSATVGYDLATGWGSPNGSGLITALLGAISQPGYGLTASKTALTLPQGGSGSSTITSTVINGFSSAIALSATGLPSGVTVTFSPTSITGTGSSTVTIAVAATTAAGNYKIKVVGTSNGTTEMVAISLTVNDVYFTIASSPASLSIAEGGSGTAKINTVAAAGFDSALTLSATGYPTGVTISLSPKAIKKPGTGTSTMTVKVGKKVKAGNYTITLNVSGGGVTHTLAVPLAVTP
jgi:kumamolisin